MRVLALDTTTPGGSTALIEDTRVVGAVAGDPGRSQAEQLPDGALRLLRSARCTLADVECFAVASGPGSFTGLRIGIATIQGLAFVTRRPVVPVSALDALGFLAAREVEPDAVVAAWMDARRGEVFSALYRVAHADDFTRERLVAIEAAAVGEPGATLERWSALAPPPAVFAGDGASLHAGVIGGTSRILPAEALAPAIGLAAVSLARSGLGVSPNALQPLYIRRPDAEIARDRQSAR